jgi:2-methylcitrate dehydratase PrpD
MSEPRTEAARAREARHSRLQQKISRQLDEALAGTFPASDPVSIHASTEDEDDGGEDPEPAGPASTARSAPASSPPGSRS